MKQFLSFRFGIRSLLAITMAVAFFFSGYRVGYNHGELGRRDGFERLRQLIADNVKETWELGEQHSFQNNLSITCYSHCGPEFGATDADDIWKTDGAESNPFGEVSDNPFELDPFK